MPVPGADFPLYAGSELAISGSEVTVTVKIRAAGMPVKLTADAPAAATASSTLGQPGSVPRNRCVTAGYADAFPQDCGYPAVLAVDTQAANASVSLNASITIGEDGSSLVLRTTLTYGLVPVASSMGRASWPLTTFFSEAGLPVIPWFANFTTVDPATPPSRFADDETVAAQIGARMQREEAGRF